MTAHLVRQPLFNCGGGCGPGTRENCSDEVEAAKAIQTMQIETAVSTKRVDGKTLLFRSQQSDHCDLLKRFLNCSCVSCGASGRGEVVGIETITINGTVYNGNTDVFTRIESLYPTFVLTRVNLPDVAVTVAGTTID